MKIHLRFIKNSGFISRAIGWETWGAGGSWSHVEFKLHDAYMGSQAPDGVQIRPLNYCDTTSEFHCSVSVTGDQYRKVMYFLFQQKGKPYDYKSILGFLIKRDWRATDSWFCSELVAAAFEHAGIPLLRTEECNRVSPSTLSLSPLLVREESNDCLYCET